MSNQIVTMIEVAHSARNRKTVFWRPILAIPTLIFVGSFMPLGHWGWGVSGLVVVPVLLSMVFRGKYPSYVLTFNHAIMELQTRVMAYLFLIQDDYPTIERNPKVAVIFPDVQEGRALNQWLPIVKWFLAIPLYIVGALYTLWAFVVTVVAWIMTWSTGNYPHWASDFVLRLIQFWNRVAGYAVILVTDEYPSFAL